MKNEFQYRLQKSIAKSGLTASELSKATGISEVNISNYINGKYVAKQDKVFLLAQALNVDPGWLMTGVEPTRIPDDHQAEPHTVEAKILATGVDRLPKEQREQALAVMRAVFAQYSDYFNAKENDDET